MHLRALSLLTLICLAAVPQRQEPAPKPLIEVRADQATRPVSRLLTGACIEDVNHEIYGGLYSQMVFGESFQEPSVQSPVKGFRAFDGRWSVEDGEAGVEVFFPDKKAGNAGLIVRVGKPGVGADNFDGYEVSLDPARGVL